MSRATLGLVVASLLLCVAGLAPAAHAAVSVTCVGTSNITFSPGLTLFIQPVQYNLADTYTCTSTDPAITSASGVAGRVLPLSCLSPASLFNSTNGVTITWNNGQTSNAQGTFSVTSAGGTNIVVFQSTISTGLFTGANAVFTWVWPALNPAACLSPQGVSQLAGATTVQITSL
jgi:hypothetical protein